MSATPTDAAADPALPSPAPLAPAASPGPSSATSATSATAMTSTSTSTSAPAPVARPASRRHALGLLALLLLLAGAAYAVYWSTVLNHFEHTDNAYVQGNVVQITPQIAGTVVAIHFDETDRVKAGQPLLRLDSADAEVALLQAQAQLAQAVREVRTLYANNDTLSAQIAPREADLARTQTELARAQDDLARRAPLVASGAVSQEDLAHASSQLASAQVAVRGAQAAVLAARQQLTAGQAMTDGTSAAQHPSVLRAAARLREVALALHRAELPAPLAGVVAKRAVQIGQRVQAGQPLMTVVALDALWVDANFKEGQLGRLRVGQPATLVADVYGARTEFHGKVAGLGAGTGAAFALLPAQNATGNWIKVVQRVPVRISLDAAELAAHPLRVGLSMEVQIDIRDSHGQTLVAAPRTTPVAQTAVFDGAWRETEEQVQRIIRANLAGPGTLPPGQASPPGKPAATGSRP